jgi:hypothetical protein
MLKKKIKSYRVLAIGIRKQGICFGVSLPERRKFEIESDSKLPGPGSSESRPYPRSRIQCRDAIYCVSTLDNAVVVEGVGRGEKFFASTNMSHPIIILDLRF